MEQARRGSVALAAHRLMATGLAPVAAVSVGTVGGEPLLDLSTDEDVRADRDMNVVMNRDGRCIEVEEMAERQPLDRALLNRLLDERPAGSGSCCGWKATRWSEGRENAGDGAGARAGGATAARTN